VRFIAAEVAVKVLVVAGAFRVSGLARSAAGAIKRTFSKKWAAQAVRPARLRRTQSGDKSPSLHTQAPFLTFSTCGAGFGLCWKTPKGSSNAFAARLPPAFEALILQRCRHC